jgi:hypothetical protein
VMSSPTNDSLFLTKLSAGVLAGRLFLIKTQPCVRLFAHLSRWLTTGTLGAVVYGRPRLGKTSASRWVLASLREHLGPIPWVEIPVRKETLASERAFFQHLLHCVRHRFYNKGSSTDKRDRFIEALYKRARRSSTRTVILFFDEAQLLNETHYQWMINISNELEVRGYRLFCLLVGQHELVSRKNSFMAQGREEIVGRFMTEDWAFPGIEMLPEFKKCLEEFDAVIYPQHEGKPFLAYFLPIAYQAGWRLSQTAESMWLKFSEQWQAAGRKDNPIIPMHYFCSAVINLLYELSKNDNIYLDASEKVINFAVNRSGYKNALKALTIPTPNHSYA